MYASNDDAAASFRKELEANKTYSVNLMSSPGSGKTTLLVNTINRIKDQFKIGIVEADVDSDVDAYTILNETGVSVNQIHSGGMCHIDAGMAREGLEDIQYGDFDFCVIENIGNLICPASYDLGQALNTMILSVPEGDDKPLKYPLMFSVCHALVINKVDYLSLSNFDVEKCRERVLKINPDIKIFEVSCQTGEGIDQWVKWLYEEVVKL